MNSRLHSAAIHLLVGTSLTLAMGLAEAQPAAGTPNPSTLNDLDCRTLLRLGGEERAYTLLYMHGFVSGKKGQVVLPAQELAEATDRIVDHCIDRPGDRLLSVFEAVRAK